MKILVVTSVLDLTLPFGCTAAWWQLLKALHGLGAEVIATPYYGRPVPTLWWRTYDNPCYGLGRSFAGLRNLARCIPGTGRSAAQEAGDSAGQKMQRGLVHLLVKPRWQRHLFSICENEKGLDAILFLSVPLNHLAGVPRAVRDRFGVPVT